MTDSPPAHSRLALSSPRARLDLGWAASGWAVDPDLLLFRGLVTNAGPAYSVPLGHRSGGAARGVRLLPHDWREEGLRVACESPPSTATLALSVEALDPQEARSSVSWAVWIEPALVDPSALPPSAPVAQSGSSAGATLRRYSGCHPGMLCGPAG